MTLDKKKVLAAAIGCALCLAVIGCIAIGFYIGKAVYDRPMDIDIKRDTVTLWDTIPHWYPVPVETKPQKPQYKWLTRVETTTDTLLMRDSVLVEVPIESKHYNSPEYDAWVSGYQPSLDSIKVYQKETVITETITKVVKERNHFFLDVGAGCEYIPNTKTSVPFSELGVSFKKGRFGIGAYGGYSHDIHENKALPYAKAKLTYDIIHF